MKKVLVILSIVCLAFTIFSANGAEMVHPGMSHSKTDFKQLKKHVKSEDEPWKSAWRQLLDSKYASLNYQGKSRSHIARGPYNKPDIGGNDFMDDGCAAYTMMLRWIVEKDDAYAEKAIDIINAWSYKLDSVTMGDNKLLIGMGGTQYLNAAEILKHVYKKWKKDDVAAFEKMLLEVWYPVIEDFQPTYNGNWDAAIGRTMMCIGIFTDRVDIFEKAYRHLLEGDSNGAIDNYFYPNGQCQESGRDMTHVQMGLGFLTQACEIACNQGFDLYSAYDNRLATGVEYTAKYMLGEDVPYEQYVNYRGKKVFGPEISPKGRGKFSPVYELPYRHYHDRMGMDMPYTKRAIEKSRMEGASRIFMSWATLMNAGNFTDKLAD